MGAMEGDKERGRGEGWRKGGLWTLDCILCSLMRPTCLQASAGMHDVLRYPGNTTFSLHGLISTTIALALHHSFNKELACVQGEACVSRIISASCSLT